MKWFRFGGQPSIRVGWKGMQAAGTVSSLLLLLVVSRVPSGLAQEGSGLSSASSAAAAARPHPPRQAWTTSRFRGTPDPPAPYRVEVAFPHLRFVRPVTITSAPGSHRLFVVQVDGQIVSFPEDGQCRAVDLFADLKAAIPRLTQTYGMAFHPQYPEQPYVYLCYVLQGAEPDGSVISRFTVQPGDPPVIDPSSERVVIRWLAGGHNGCCLKFGPDGYLYISTGDGAGPNPPDPLRAGQDISNLLSAILRIDIDRSEAGRNYAIPTDNPFTHLPSARGEIWAYGFRNPWKMSFDRLTGDLWVGDVGWDTWELVYRITRGGNYGWSITEGSQPVHPDEQQGPTPILPPITQHAHAEARSITGGYVYRGKLLPDLQGAYVYGDYSTGKIWALRCDGTQVISRQEIADTDLQIVGWCETNQAELYLIDYETTQQIYRLVPNDDPAKTTSFPRKLSETGLFASVGQQLPAPGVIPYEVNAAMWQDGATAERFLAIPHTAPIEGNRNHWRFPDGTVVARTVSIERVPGRPSSRQRLETQILHYDQGDWHAYAYVWNDTQDDAELAPAEGMILQIPSQEAANPADTTDTAGGRWRVASRAECKLCHVAHLGGVLGLNQLQIPSSARNSEETALTSQLLRWQEMGLVSPALLPNSSRTADTLVDPDDETADLDRRARSYLHVNCASCHRPGGTGTSVIHLEYERKLSETLTINQPPAQGSFGLATARIIVPGNPYRSVLFYRMAKTGRGHMPHIGATEVDPRGLRLIHDWIAHGPSILEMGAATPELPELPPRPIWTEPSRDKLEAEIRSLLNDSSTALQLAWQLETRQLPQSVHDPLVQQGSRHADLNIRDLFERFLPAADRVRRLGPAFDPREVLSLKGDLNRGRQLYWHTAASQCQSCHTIHGYGGVVGPDLSEIGSKYTAPQLLEEIIAPSQRMDPSYRTYVLTHANGQTFSGVLLQRNAQQIALRTPDGTTHHLPADQVESLIETNRSLMPDQLLRDLTPQQAADLLSYLQSLRSPPEHAPR